MEDAIAAEGESGGLGRSLTMAYKGRTMMAVAAVAKSQTTINTSGRTRNPNNPKPRQQLACKRADTQY